MNFRYLFALCLLWIAVGSLLGCGAGADSKSTDTALTPTSPGSSPSVPASVPASVTAGVYSASVNGQEFWGMITPGNRWYGLLSNSNGFDIYSGDVQDVGTLSASVPVMKYQNNAARYFGGTARLTSTGTDKLSGTLTLSSEVSIQPVAFTNALKTHSFSSNAPASLSDIAGSWTGELSYGLGVSSAFTILVDAASGAITAPGFNSCNLNPTTSSAKPVSNAAVFTLTLSTQISGVSTGCDAKLNNKTFNGMAFAVTVPGSTPRLMMVATDSDGYAIAFKAQR